MFRVTEEQVARIAQTSIGPIVRGFVRALNERGDEFGINTYLRVVHFIGQCAEETQFNTMREIGPPSYFSKYEPGTRVGHMLGNTLPGDGARFKGRGPIQLTGRAWYSKFTEAMGKELGIDFVASPERLEEPYYGTIASMWYWREAKVNQFSDRDDTRAETRRINGGYTNYEKRVYFIARAKAELKGNIQEPANHDQPVIIPAEPKPPPPDVPPVEPTAPASDAGFFAALVAFLRNIFSPRQ